MGQLGTWFQDLLVAEQLVAELEQIKQANVGDEQSLPPIKVSVHGNHYEVDIAVKRTG